MKALQALKFMFKQDRLDFSSHFTATEDEFRFDNVSLDVVRQLIAEKRFSELEELLIHLS